MKATLLFTALISCLYTPLPTQNNKTAADTDGNIYTMVNIDNKEWLAENLKTTKYNYVTPIPIVANDVEGKFLSTPALCWFDNDSSNLGKYGCLYNWYAVNTGKLALRDCLPTNNLQNANQFANRLHHCVQV